MKVPFYLPVTSLMSADNVCKLVNEPRKLLEKRFTKKCQQFFEEQYPGYRAFMTSSCTRALELIAISCELTQEDEVVLPSFNYVGVANAFAQTGAKLVFADLDKTYYNMSLQAIEAVVSEKTKVVVVLNYAGVGFELQRIQKFCKEKGIILVEDNAQGINSKNQDRLLGSYGDISCISFDGLKNITCGEGGVLLVKEHLAEQMDVTFNNGTNRTAFDKGKVNAYEWIALGSKFAISEFNAAILHPLLLETEAIISKRREVWYRLYNKLNAEPSLQNLLPHFMFNEQHNGHIFPLISTDLKQRDTLLKSLNNSGVECMFHYTPLHTSKFGSNRYEHRMVDLNTTNKSNTLIRLPINNFTSDKEIDYLVVCLLEAIV